MLNRVNKVFIGKQIARTSSLSLAVTSPGSQNIAQGEIVVLDQNKNILSAGATISETPIIYIAEGLPDTYSIVNTAGTSITGIRKILYSDPIRGMYIRNYEGRAYSASTEEVVTITMTTNFTPVVGALYKIRVIYTDTFEKPGQVTSTYYYNALTAYTGDLVIAFAALINADPNARVIATYTGTSGNQNGVLILTGKVLPYNGVTDSVNSIDIYQQVNFKATLYSNNYGTSTVAITTRPTPGQGIWQRVRDDEKLSMANQRGVTNFIWFPIITPPFRTQDGVVNGTVAGTYNTIIIEHEADVLTNDNQYRKQQPQTTTIYMFTSASQVQDVLDVLNPWMASTPNAFDSVNLF